MKTKTYKTIKCEFWLILVVIFLTGCGLAGTSNDFHVLLDSGTEEEIENFMLNNYEELQFYNSTIQFLEEMYPNRKNEIRANHYISSGYTNPVPIRKKNGEIENFDYQISFPMVIDSGKKNSSVSLRAFYGADKKLIRLRIQTTPY
jgi:ABC-type lipoprotein release transport system permease subunit